MDVKTSMATSLAPFKLPIIKVLLFEAPNFSISDKIKEAKSFQFRRAKFTFELSCELLSRTDFSLFPERTLEIQPFLRESLDIKFTKPRIENFDLTITVVEQYFYAESSTSIKFRVIGKNYISRIEQKKILTSEMYSFDNNSVYLSTEHDLYDILLTILQPSDRESKNIFNLHWDNVEFLQGAIHVRFDGKFLRFNLKDSKRIYNSYKLILKSGKFGNISLELLGKERKPFRLVGADIIEKIFDVFEIENWLENSDLGKVDLFDSIIGEWDNIRIIETLKIREKSIYLDYLCDMCPLSSSEFKIIPMRERRSQNSSDSIIEEDAFLFPVRRERLMYILWESIEESRATHVFRFLLDHYRVASQKVFDYVVSPGVTNKRERLHNSRFEYFSDGVVRYVGSANHYSGDVMAWKRKLAELTR